jgi:F0F1-type ATP synthase assembly protein I
LILTRDPDSRRVAARILLLQASVTIGLAAACYGALGRRHAASLLAGGAIGLVANAVMTVFALRETRTAGGALVRLVVGQFVKVGLTVALFVIAARTGKVAWPPFLVGYVATLLAFWAAPLWWARRAGAAATGSVQGRARDE